MQSLQNIWREAWRPPDRRTPGQWCEEHIGAIPYSPMPGHFRSDSSPWVCEVMEAIVDPRIRLRDGAHLWHLFQDLCQLFRRP